MRTYFGREAPSGSAPPAPAPAPADAASLTRLPAACQIIGIRDIMRPTSVSGFEDVYIVSDLMETDLHRIIYSKQDLTDDHVQYFIYQVLRSLKYMHSANVLHRDLKPSNLLLNSNCDLKVCDFGLARCDPASCRLRTRRGRGRRQASHRLAPPHRGAPSRCPRGTSDEDNQGLTEYVVTRWYRAPEIMLSCRVYTNAIDVWSVGCILAELLGRKPLFPGDDYIHQLQVGGMGAVKGNSAAPARSRAPPAQIIADVVGTPAEEDLHFVTSSKARRFMRNMEHKSKVAWSRLFPHANSEALDLLDKMLVFDPSRRISVEDALRHPYMASLHNPEDEPSCGSKFSFDFEKEHLDKPRIQELIFECGLCPAGARPAPPHPRPRPRRREMCEFHPDAKEDLERHYRHRRRRAGK